MIWTLLALGLYLAFFAVGLFVGAWWAGSRVLYIEEQAFIRGVIQATLSRERTQIARQVLGHHASPN